MSDVSSQAARNVAHNLVLDVAAGHAAQVLEQHGIPVVLLKGPTWELAIYGSRGSRHYTDIDFLIDPTHYLAATRIVSELGFEQVVSEIPGDRPAYATTWNRQRDGVVVELHRSLGGLDAVDPRALWEILSADLRSVEIAGFQFKALSETAIAFHAAVHAFHHGSDDPKPVHDLRVAVTNFDRDVWSAATDLAARLGATAEFVAGLGRVPGSAALVGADALSASVSRGVALRSGSDAVVGEMAVTVDYIASLPLRDRVSILARKAFPPRGYLEAWARSTFPRRRLPLIVAYAVRPVWLLHRGLKAVRVRARLDRRLSRERRGRDTK